MSKKTIITLVFSFCIACSLIGTFAFFKMDHTIKKERDHLLEHGIKTSATVNSIDKKSNRRMSPNSGRWHYMNDYYITFTYYHDSVSRESKITVPSLADYLKNEDIKTKKVKPKNRTRVTSLTDKDLYKTKKIGQSVNIIYLYGEPTSARVLNDEGKLMTPNFFIFGIISLLLFLASASMLYYFRKTGKTF